MYRNSSGYDANTYLPNHNVILDKPTLVAGHFSGISSLPMVKRLPTPMVGVNLCEGLSTTLPKITQTLTSSSVMVRASHADKPVAGGKVLSKPRRNTKGEWGLIDSLGIGRSDVTPSPSVNEDVFVVKIPNSKDEYFIPGKYVRKNSAAINEVTVSYANLLNVSADELRVVEMDLTAQFDAIRLEFSEAHFREEVLAAAAGFQFSADVCSRDTFAYNTAGNSVAVLVDQLQKSKAHDRFNQERCDAIFRGDPEYDRLSSLATEGVIIDKPDGLILQSVPEPPRKLQQQLDLAYRQHASKVWDKSNGIILELSALSTEDKAKIHFNPAHLTRKPGGSRFCMDCTNSESGNVLNTPDVKVKVLERYEYADGLGVPLRDCRLFKDDFSGTSGVHNFLGYETTHKKNELFVAIGPGL